MRYQFIIIFLLCQLPGFSQFGQLIEGVVSDTIIKKNKVYKCTETYVEDSLYFKKRNQNNPYIIYNKKGLKSEFNFYRIGDNIEMKTIFIYDKNKNLKSWLWYNQFETSPVSRLVINQIDSTNTITSSEDIMNFNNSSIIYKENKTLNSIITNQNSIVKIFKNSSGDTLEIQSKYLNTNGLTDSTVIKYYNNTIYTGKTVREFTYKNGVKKTLTFKSYNKEHKLEVNEVYKFSENGLPISKLQYWTKGEKRHSLRSKFYYNYYD
jgi:hypothetical protein